MSPDSLNATLDSLSIALKQLAISDRNLEALAITVDGQVKNYMMDCLTIIVVGSIFVCAIAYGCRSYFKYRLRKD